MAPKAHADLSASSAHRWINCPGSVRLSAGQPDRSSEYAREGTAAHTLLERALRKRLPALTWLDTEIPVPYRENDAELVDHVTVTEEMCEAVQVIIDQVLRLIDHPTTQLFIEQKFDLSKLNPPGPMYGTADVVIWAPHHKHLAVLDLKYGKGVAVDATENEQLLYYLLGAVIAIDVMPDTLSATIVQPRAHHPQGIIRSYPLDFATLKNFKQNLFLAAEKTLAEDAPLVPGDHCRFCKALPICPAQRELAMEVAQTTFDAIDEPRTLPAPELLTDEQISRILVVEDQLTEWLRSVKQYVTNKLERGESVPGWKLVAKRATRRWKGDEADIREDLLKQGLEEDAIYTRKMVSPAQAEKAFKALKVKPVLDGLVDKTSSGFNLAPDNDPRPALLVGATEAFADTPDEPSTTAVPQ